MELSQNIKDLIGLEAEKYPQKQLIAAAERVSLAYRENSGSGAPLVSDKISALAYAAVRLPATFAAAASALSKTAELFGGEIHTMLDAGAGCGAVTLAAAEIFPGLENIVCIEREPEMSAIGKTLTESERLPCGWRQGDITEAAFPKADLVCASYVMNEIRGGERAALTGKLWNAAEKLLIIIEPGTPAGYRGLMSVRAELISRGARILAPCPHSGECPLPSDDWCHFTARTSRSRLHKKLKGGEAPFEDEKFCYIAAVKGEEPPCEARILRHPKIESGKITLRLCTRSGIAERTVTKKDGAEFKRARKSGSGDALVDKSTSR